MCSHQRAPAACPRALRAREGHVWTACFKLAPQTNCTGYPQNVCSSRTSERDLPWKQTVCGVISGDEVTPQQGGPWSRVTGDPTRPRHRAQGEGHVAMEEDRVRHLRPRSPRGHGHHPHLERQGGPSPGALRRSSAPPMPWSWTSSLRNHDGTISGVLSHPVCDFATAANTEALRHLVPSILPGVQAVAGPAATSLLTWVLLAPPRS